MSRLALLAALACWSCGDADAPAEPLCDGRPGLALAYQVMSSPARLVPGSQVLNDNGGWFLFVDGACRYWTIPPGTPGEWADLRSGTLSESEAAQLAADLAVADYPRLEGVHHDPLAGVFDGPTLRFHDGTHRVECASACEGDLPPELVSATAAGVEWVERLWDRGQPVGGDVRTVVVRLGEPQELLGPAAPWPAGDVAAVAISHEEADLLGYGEGVLVEGANADALRALRAEYRDGEHGDWFYRYIPIEDPTGESAGYRAYVRDTLPFEDESGIVVPPPLP